MVAGNQYEVGDRFDQFSVVGMPINKRGKGWKQDLHCVLVLSTGSLFHAGKCVSKPVYVREVRIDGELFTIRSKPFS